VDMIVISNRGFPLLREIVARTSRVSFAEFTRNRLFESLGMKTTTYLDSPGATGWAALHSCS
jgi:CubicO group peptidase (beta-lactamase class C family)